MTTLLIHPYSPRSRPVDQAQTWEFLLQVRNLRPEIIVKHVPCYRPDDYSAALAYFWDFDGKVCIIEQDIVPTLEILDSLIECYDPLCCQVYQLYSATTGLRDQAVYAQRHKTSGREPWITDGDTIADASGFGLVKFDLKVRRAIAIPDFHGENGMTWRDLDTRISNLIHNFTEYRWHCHWPCIVHNHK